MEKYSYEAGRRLVDTGDLLVWSGNSLFSKVIKFATESEYTHVGIAWKSDETGRLIVIESMDGKGVQLAPLSRRAPVICLKTHVELKHVLLDAAMKHWGEKYSWFGCLRAWLGFNLTEDDRWQCAEFANYLLNEANIFVPPQCTTPAKLANHFGEGHTFYLKGKREK